MSDPYDCKNGQFFFYSDKNVQEQSKQSRDQAQLKNQISKTGQELIYNQIHIRNSQQLSEQPGMMEEGQEVFHQSQIISQNFGNSEDSQNDQEDKEVQQEQKNQNTSQSKALFRSIFKQNPIKPKKNNNVVKHFLKKIIHLYKIKGQSFFDETSLIPQMNSFILKQKKMYKEYKNWNNNLQSMNKVFGINDRSENPQLRSLLTRKMANYLIRSSIIPEVLSNGQISTAYEYLLTLKVLMHRTRNIDLMKRTTSH